MNALIDQAIPNLAISARTIGAWSLLTVAFLITVGCASVPHTGRRQFNMVPDDQLNALGMKAFQEVLSKEPEATDKRLVDMVQRVADRVSAAAEALDKPRFKWQAKLVNKDIPNAVCLPGGKIIVFSGILPYAKNEAGLAAIIAHEVAHAVARHGGERLSQQVALRGALSAGGELLRNKDGTLDTRSRILLGALGLGGTLGIVLPYSRTHEFEADRIGQLYLAKAGYDPAEAVRLWSRMAKIQKPPIPVWLSTHPADEDRVAELRKFLPDAQKFYGEAPVKFGAGEPL